MRPIFVIALLLLIIGAALTIIPTTFDDVIGRLQQSVKNLFNQADQDLSELASTLTPLTQYISTPDPLRGETNTALSATLTTNGVFTATNQHREDNNLPTLKRNLTLDQAAANKLEDMFTQQYFEHISPNGVGPGDVVTAVGYDFLTTGENLALGNFASDAALVQAWMDSPGHRANILGEQFQEIGLAVGQGQFEGTTTWLAVQTFATPASVCPLPSPALKSTIDSALTSENSLNIQLDQKLTTINQLERELSTLNQEIKRLQTAGENHIKEGNKEIEEGNRLAKEGRRKEAEAHWERGEQLQQQGRAELDQAEQLINTYNQKVAQLQDQQSEYNQLVAQLRSFNDDLASRINQYNQQVRTYNECADQFATS